MSAVDAALAKGFVDPQRLFVTGGSGGGVLTAWIVGKTHRFRAAVSQKPVVNWSSEVLTTDIYPWMADYWFGKLPWEDPAGYWKRSPLSLVGNVTTPTLVIVGASDVRTPDSEAEQLYGALQLRGVPTGLVKVPGAFHDMAARPSHAAAKATTVLAWFARYGGEPPVTPAGVGPPRRDRGRGGSGASPPPRPFTAVRVQGRRAAAVRHPKLQAGERRGAAAGAGDVRHLGAAERGPRQRRAPALALHGRRHGLRLADRGGQGAGPVQAVPGGDRAVRQRPVLLALQHARAVPRPALPDHHHPRQRRGRAGASWRRPAA